MRIAISGASGTGKTTLARSLAEHYKIPMNPVGARSVALEMGFDNPYDVDAAGRRVEFQARLFESKRAWELGHESFVTDRSYFDNLAYCALHMASSLEPDAIEVFSRAMERYDVVFFLPRAKFQDLSDGVRVTAPGYHAMYEFVLESLFRREEAEDKFRGLLESDYRPPDFVWVWIRQSEKQGRFAQARLEIERLKREGY